MHVIIMTTARIVMKVTPRLHEPVIKDGEIEGVLTTNQKSASPLIGLLSGHRPLVDQRADRRLSL